VADERVRLLIRYAGGFAPWLVARGEGTVAILAVPWLAGIALILALLVAIRTLAALARAVVSAVHALVRSLPRRPWERVTQTHALR
jgi:hypothetical protein